MSTTSKTTQKSEDFLVGISCNKENDNVLDKENGDNKNDSNIKQKVDQDAISSVTEDTGTLNGCKEKSSSKVDLLFLRSDINDNYTNKTSNEQDSQLTEIEPAADGKTNKKKLKKLKQKLKKQAEKINQIEETKANAMEIIKEEDEIKEHELKEEFVDTDSPATTSKDLDQIDKCDDVDNSNAKDECDEEIDFLSNISTFFHTALKKDNKKSLTTKTCKQSKQENDIRKVNFKETNLSSEILNNNNDEYDDIDMENDFTLVKYKHSKHPDSHQSSEDFGRLAIQLILENQISQAIQHLSTAISLDKKNVCHYVNRSFCFLRAGTYNLAIKDANFVIKNTSDNNILAKANYLLGEAYYYLKNYEEAEKSMQKCLDLFPQNLCYIRELLRFKVSQLVNMGFCERDALLAIKNHSTVTDAMETLITETNMQKTNNNCDNNNYYTTLCVFYDESGTFYSDDEDNCGNTQLLSSIIKEKFPFCHEKIVKRSHKKPIKNISKKSHRATK